MGTKIFIPKMGANIESVEIGKIFVKKGDIVNKGDILFEIITDKATFEIEADSEGEILEFNCNLGEELQILDEVGFIGLNGEDIPFLKKSKDLQDKDLRLKATPAAKKLAEEKGLDINKIFKGVDKIIKEEDIIRFLDNSNLDKNIRIEDLNFRKKAEIRNLSKSKEDIVSSIITPVGVKKIEEKINKYSMEKNMNLSIGEYISYTAIKALKKFPRLNSFFDSEKIHLYEKINLGFAVGLNEELFVPVISEADKMDLNEFSSKIKESIMKVLKKENIDESSASFTFTDLSSYGVFSFLPVINFKQSAILGLGAKYDSCTFIDSKIEYSPKINLILVFDHRVVNGKYASEFLEEIKKNLEN